MSNDTTVLNLLVKLVACLNSLLNVSHKMNKANGSSSPVHFLEMAYRIYIFFFKKDVNSFLFNYT